MTNYRITVYTTWEKNSWEGHWPWYNFSTVIITGVLYNNHSENLGKFGANFPGRVHNACNFY